MAKAKDGRQMFVLLAGDHEGVDLDGNRKRFRAGDEVPLTFEQAQAFADRFVSVEEYESRKKHEEAVRQARADLEKARADASAYNDSVQGTTDATETLTVVKSNDGGTETDPSAATYPSTEPTPADKAAGTEANPKASASTVQTNAPKATK